MREIHTKALAREFGSITAVESLDLEVHEGEIYVFLGPNGAGKSTTINMLLGFTPPSSGSGTVLGHDIEDESLVDIAGVETVSTADRIDGDVPFYLETWFAWVFVAAWIIVPLGIGYYRFNRAVLS